MPAYHPSQDLILDYAAGTLREPTALVVATHLTLCGECQAELARLEAVGGAMLETLEAETLPEDALDRVLARVDAAGDKVETAAPQAAVAGDPRVPAPLRDYLPGNLDSLKWKNRGAFGEVSLLPEFPGYKTRLMRIKGGTTLPRHTHEGTELTLVLSGGFSDSAGHYLPGDVALADTSIDHQPVADPGEDCLCLAVTDAPMRLTGAVGRHFNFLARF